MRRTKWTGLLVAALLGAPASQGQAPGNPPPGMQSAKERRERMFQEFPLNAGDPFPELDIFDAQGKRMNTRSLKGKYTVIVNGCLT